MTDIFTVISDSVNQGREVKIPIKLFSPDSINQLISAMLNSGNNSWYEPSGDPSNPFLVVGKNYPTNRTFSQSR